MRSYIEEKKRLAKSFGTTRQTNRLLDILLLLYFLKNFTITAKSINILFYGLFSVNIEIKNYRLNFNSHDNIPGM